MKNLRIGILGGTFNPIHKGHIRLACQAREKLKLDKVIFVPANIPPHKTNLNISPARQRYAMVLKAIEKFPYFAVSDFEIRKGGVSFSVKTLQAFRKKFGKNAELFFLTGSDSLKQLRAWKSLDKVMSLADFVVIPRPGYKINPATGIKILHINPLDISSSCIRQRIGKKLSVREFLQKPVYDYILKKGLYLK